jgi:hypothetical protein
MVRRGYVEWYGPEELADTTPFADPEVRARMAALISRAAQNRHEELSPSLQSPSGRDDEE